MSEACKAAALAASRRAATYFDGFVAIWDRQITHQLHGALRNAPPPPAPCHSQDIVPEIAVTVARGSGQSRQRRLRGFEPEPGLRRQLRPWCSGHVVLPEFTRATFVFPSTAIGPMANAGECPKFLL